MNGNFKIRIFEYSTTALHSPAARALAYYRRPPNVTELINNRRVSTIMTTYVCHINSRYLPDCRQAVSHSFIHSLNAIMNDILLLSVIQCVREQYYKNSNRPS